MRFFKIYISISVISRPLLVRLVGLIIYRIDNKYSTWVKIGKIVVGKGRGGGE